MVPLTAFVKSIVSTRWVRSHLLFTMFTKQAIKRNGGNGIWTRGCWVRSVNVTSLLCRPPTFINLKQKVFFDETLNVKSIMIPATCPQLRYVMSPLLILFKVQLPLLDFLQIFNSWLRLKLKITKQAKMEMVNLGALKYQEWLIST